MSIEARLLDIARPLLPSFPELPSDEALRVERDLAAALDAQIAELPRYLAAPFHVALVAFEERRGAGEQVVDGGTHGIDVV